MAPSNEIWLEAVRLLELYDYIHYGHFYFPNRNSLDLFKTSAIHLFFNKEQICPKRKIFKDAWRGAKILPLIKSEK